MRALITGAAGFVGSRLLAGLRDAGHTAIGLDLRHTDIVADVRDAGVVFAAMAEAEPDVVFHLAGPVLGSVSQNAGAAIELQIGGTLSVLAATRRLSRPPLVVLASSFQVYGAQPPAAVVDETTLLDLMALRAFAGCKLTAEYLVRAFGRAHGIPYRILRLGSIYGPGCSNAIGDFLTRGLAGCPMQVWGSGNRLNQYVHVDDVVAGSILAAQSSRDDIINLIPEETVTVLEVADLLAKEFGFTVAIDPDRPEGPPFPRMLSRRAAGFGWRPRRLRDGLRETCTALQANRPH